MKRTRSIQGQDRAEVESLDGTPLILRYSLHPLKFLLLSFYRVKFLKVEIAVIVYMIGRHLYNPLYQQYYYHIYGADILKNTSFVAPNGSFCLSSTLIDNYTGNNDSYKLDEAFSNHLVAYGQLANAIPSMIVTIILGPVTDKYGRKIGIILPAIGTTLQGIFIFFIIKYTLDPYYFILANFISGSFGDFTSILSSSFAYVADVSSTRWRTLRIGLVQSALSIGSASGGIIVGYWLHAINCDSLPPLWAYIGCSLFIVVYTTLCVPESLSRGERTKLHGKSRRGVRSFVEGLRLYCGGLSLATTWRLYVTTAVMYVAVLNIYGGTLIEVYFLKALPFNFNSLQIGIYQSVREATQGLFSLFFMTVLVICSIADTWIILLATLVHCGCLVLLGFSNKTWQLYTSKLNNYTEDTQALRKPAIASFSPSLRNAVPGPLHILCCVIPRAT